jgi:hypothetical protein
MAVDTPQHLAMLRILYGACSAALDAFRAADNPVDSQLVADLETMMLRTHGEIERLTALLGSRRRPSSIRSGRTRPVMTTTSTT